MAQELQGPEREEIDAIWQEVEKQTREMHAYHQALQEAARAQEEYEKIQGVTIIKDRIRQIDPRAPSGAPRFVETGEKEAETHYTEEQEKRQDELMRKTVESFLTKT